MKSLFSFFLLFGLFNNPTIGEIRKLYPDAANSESNATVLATKLANISVNDDKTLLAYKGASMTMVAKFEKKLKNKINGLKEGAKLTEFAINSEPNNIEIRLIRLSIQENVPAIVKYKKNIKEDKYFLLKHFKEQSTSLKEYLKNFIMQSKSFSAQEKQTIT
jgi:hypothetical protein